MYALRFTPYETIYRNPLFFELFLRTLTKQYVFGIETTKNLHYHAVLPVKVTIDHFQDEEIKGNKYFSCPKVKITDSAVQYAVKDGEWHTNTVDLWIGDNMWKNYVNEMSELSYKKPKSYDEQFKIACQKYEDDEISAKELWIQVATARSYFNLRVSTQQLDELVRSQMWKKNPSLIEQAANKSKLFSCL